MQDGSLGNPFVFKSIIEGKEYIPTALEKYNTILKHIDLACKYEGEKISRLKLRKHIAWYLKGLKHSNIYKDKVNKSESIEEIKEIVKEALDVK